MGFRASRLRRGEVIAALAAVVLLADLFALRWFTGAATAISGQSGWDVLTVARWLVLITGVVALALAWFQATRRAPALPASLSVIATVLGAITALVLLWRVLLDPPGLGRGAMTCAGAYVGLVAALVLAAAALLSLREEDPPDPQRNAAIPIVSLPG